MTNLAINLTKNSALKCTILPISIATLNFEKLKFKLTSSKEFKMSKDVCDFAEQEYKRFLALKYGGVSKSMLKKSRLNFDKIEKCK